jgi:hypothetical protein
VNFQVSSVDPKDFNPEANMKYHPFIMCVLLTGLGLNLCAKAQEEKLPKVKMLDEWKEHDIPRVWSSGGTIEVKALVRSAEITLASGRKGNAFVHLVYAPKEGVYWWTILNISDIQDVNLVVSPKSMTEWESAYHALLFRQSKETASSLDDAKQKVTTELNRILNMMVRDRWPQMPADFEYIDLSALFPMNAFNLHPDSAQGSPPPKITEITYKDSQWNVRLKSVNGDVGTVVLNEPFRPVKTIFNGRQVYPKVEEK